jgi:hypothetical protein
MKKFGFWGRASISREHENIIFRRGLSWTTAFFLVFLLNVAKFPDCGLLQRCLTPRRIADNRDFITRARIDSADLYIGAPPDEFDDNAIVVGCSHGSFLSLESDRQTLSHWVTRALIVNTPVNHTREILNKRVPQQTNWSIFNQPRHIRATKLPNQMKFFVRKE